MKRSLVLMFLFSSLPAFSNDADKASFIQKVNDAFYNLSRENVAGFRCDATSDVTQASLATIEEMVGVESQTFQDLANLRHFVTWNGGVELKITSSSIASTGDANKDSGLKQISSGAAQMYEGFFSSWLDLVVEPLFNSEDQVSFTETEKGFICLMVRDGETYSVKLDKQYRLLELSGKQQGVETILRPQFEKTEKGFLPAHLFIDVADGQMMINMRINYKEVEGLPFPSLVTFSASGPGMTVDANMTYTNYSLMQP